jgi:hypothetical protein
MERAGRIVTVLLALAAVFALASPVLAAGPAHTGTPDQMVATYRSLADTILGAKKTEWNLVATILAATYQHAEGVMVQAQADMKAHKNAKADLEKLAALLSELGNEGDASVASVRKRLVEGGHHHHAAEEQQGIYDEGYVIVTRAAKKVFLEAAGNIGKMAASPNAAHLTTEWEKVRTQYNELMTHK